MLLSPDDYIKNSGRVVVGTVFDCNRKSLERMLKEYDPLLYLKWNPAKNEGRGKWELRRRPAQNRLIYEGSWQGMELFKSVSVENNMVNHILDLPCLQYNIIDKLRKMDTWTNKNWSKDLEYEEAKHKDKLKANAKAELNYNIKQHKREWREFAQLVSQGVNPAEVLKRVKWG